ncbi:MAG TPA: cell division protein ZapA [Bacteroidota bacterium]|nr:cell division protein ZapA [Bacteroidota bacterium]
MNGKSIKVKIFGSEYPLRGENEDFTKKVAAYVDSMLNRIHERIPEQPPLTVAVLSALNISEDLLKEREKNHKAVSELEMEITKLSNYLENCLSGDGEEGFSTGPR